MMAGKDTRPGPVPPRQTDVPGYYAVYLSGRTVQVWEYRADSLDADADWHHVESHDNDEAIRFTAEMAKPEPADSKGYWLYCKSYECSRGCEPMEDDSADGDWFGNA